MLGITSTSCECFLVNKDAVDVCDDGFCVPKTPKSLLAPFDVPVTEDCLEPLVEVADLLLIAPEIYTDWRSCVLREPQGFVVCLRWSRTDCDLRAIRLV